MSLTAIIDSINVNSAAAGIVVEGEAEFGESIYTEGGEKKASDGEHTTDAERRPRIAVLDLRFEGTTEATRDALYNSVKAALENSDPANPTGVLTYNPGGWTASRYLDFFYGVSTIKTTEVVAGHFNFIRRATVELVCKPHSREAALELPKNYVVDAAMCDDNNGDGVCNSFTYSEHASVTAEPSIDGGQKLTLTDSTGAGEYAQVAQTLTDIDAAEIWSYGIEYKCDAAVNCAYNIYLTYTDAAGGTEDYLLTNRTAVNGEYTKIPLPNQTIPASATGATLAINIITTGANATGALWVRLPVAAQAAALPVGADGGHIGWCSLFSETPATCRINNIPGNVDAQVFMQLIAGESSSATGTADQLVVGGGLEGTHVISFGGEVDANALGGVCSRAEAAAGEHIIALDPALRGRYLVACRLKVMTSGTPADNTFKLNVYPNADGRGTPCSTTTISPCAALGKWQGAFFFGTIELPMGGRPEWDFTTAEPQNSLGLECVNLASASWKRDFLALIPLRQGHGRIAGEILSTAAVKAAVFDSIGDPPGAYYEYELASSTAVVVNGAGRASWYANYADYTANILTVYIPEMDNYLSVAVDAGFTLVSYSTSTKLGRFSHPGGDVTFTVTITYPERDWWNYDNLPSVSNPTDPPDFDPIFIPSGDSVLIPMVAEYVNDANQNFKNVGAKIALRIIPRYL